jgi:hypothetical protein
MLINSTGMTFQDLELEAHGSKSFGYFWTTLVEEVVVHVCKNKSFPPQGWGYPGYGPSEQNWGEADLIELADFVIQEGIKKSNQHLTILYQIKDQNVESIFRLLIQPVTWAIMGKRQNSVDENAVRLIKEILKDEFSFVPKATTSASDPSFDQTVTKMVGVLKDVPQHWTHTAPLTRRGTPRKNLPPVFKKDELRPFCDFVAQLTPLPSSNQIWRAVQNVLPAKQGTQAAQKLIAGSERISPNQDLSEDPVLTKIASNQVEEGNLGSNLRHDPRETDLRADLVEAYTAFKKNLTGEEEETIMVIMNPEFTHLPQSLKAEALGVVDLNSITPSLVSLKEKSKALATDYELNEEDCNELLIHVAKSIELDRNIW